MANTVIDAGHQNMNMKIIQVNLNNCYLATLELLKTAHEMNIDIALVQEPYLGSRWTDFGGRIFDAGQGDSKAITFVRL